MEITQDMIMQYGLMSKLSTGNSFLDTILVLLVPILVNRLIPLLHTQWERLFRPTNPDKTHERVIVHKHKSCYHYWGSDDETPNHKLQQAILIYLNTLPGVLDQLESANMQLCKAKRPVKPANEGSDDGYEAGRGDGSSLSDGHDWYPGSELEEYEVKKVPPLDTCIDIEPGLEFWRTEQCVSIEKETELVITYTLLGDTAAQVDAFITKAYDAYRAMLKGENEDKQAARYLYLPVLVGSNAASGEGSDGNHMTYRRYKLSDDKSFSNFFHPDKDTITGLVDAFAAKKGKFAIQGYPHKLGFLLHGPPGTGKTTFIKALATHTKRSIISIPLARIKTNQQLMDMMFDERVKVEGEDMRVPLPFNKVIYVMEDVDAASHVVQKRVSQDTLAASLASLMSSHYTKKSTSTPSKDAQADKDRETSAPVIGPVNKPPGLGVYGVGADSGTDELNLAGLLNVLDGVVDTPGRLIIMTTNHPEQLDPALIRPGRVNKKVYMGHIAAVQALQMVQHYFGDISEQQRTRLTDMWVDGVVSPAFLEALCAEHDTVSNLLAAVQELLQFSLPSNGAITCENSSVVSSNSGSFSKQQQQGSGVHMSDTETQRKAACGDSGSTVNSNSVLIRAVSCSSDSTHDSRMVVDCQSDHRLAGS